MSGNIDYKHDYARFDWNSDAYRPCGVVDRITSGRSVLPVYHAVDGRMHMFFGIKSTSFPVSSRTPKPAAVMDLDSLGLTVHVDHMGWPSLVGNQLDDVSATLQGFFQPHDSAIESTPCTETVAFSPAAQGETIDVKLVKMRQNMPWGMRGTIHWSVTVPSFGNARVDLRAQVPVEFYFVSSPALPSFLQRGIPVKLCRKFLLPLRLMVSDPDIKTFDDAALSRSISDNADGWLTYVTEKLHFQSSISYDSFNGGSCHYWDSSYKDHRLFLDQWADDCDEKEPHVINCYDLAALMQAILPLGMTPVDKQFHMKYKKPFGYINTAHLIGREYTNNPFCGAQGANPQWICDIDDYDRSGFNSHVFVTMYREIGGDPYVLDATTRPATGPNAATQTLRKYLEHSIDDTTALYKVSPDAWAAWWKENRPEERIARQLQMGSQGSPESWSGVGSIVTHPEIYRESKPGSDAPDSDLNSFVVAMFPNQQVTSPNVTVTNDGVRKSWCVGVGANGVLALKVTSCAVPSVPPNLFARAREHLNRLGVQSTSNPDRAPWIAGAWKQSAGFASGPRVDSARRLASTDAGSAVLLWAQGSFFVEIACTSTSAAAGAASKLQAFVNRFPVSNSPRLDILVVGSAPVGNTFDIVTDGWDKNNTMSCNVEVHGNKALFLSSTQLGSRVTFTFLARAAGEDTVTLCSWGTGWLPTMSPTLPIDIAPAA
ncbi:hypothetical protein B0T24DRAFT_144389 [Lasiosphaeria ovina]|uniref:Uncharacterized protein n=1 Tax=Lasiosphaeria ovina TaxID=92902 RepID=A0AAE0KND0_9PEZI|nr:hypothetical protein B0T24DRAFT_144389 [Lasiosphaeria ovina]